MPDDVDLALSLYAQGLYAEALPLFEHTLQAFEGARGARLGDTTDAMCNLATCLMKLSNYDEAFALYRRAQDVAEPAFGLTNGYTISATHGMARCLTHMGRLDEALPLHGRVAEVMRRTKGVMTPRHSSPLEARPTASCGLAVRWRPCPASAQGRQ